MGQKPGGTTAFGAGCDDPAGAPGDSICGEEGLRRAGVEQGRNGYLLGALLLGEHLLLLLDDFCLVLEGEGEGEADEECRCGDYPDDVPDDPAGFLEEGGCFGEGRGDGLSGGGGHDVDEGGEAVVEGLVRRGVGCEGGEGVGRAGAGGRGGRVGGVVLVDDLDLDHGEEENACGGAVAASVMRKSAEPGGSVTS